MNFLRRVLTVLALLCVFNSVAQPLPNIELRQVYASLKTDKPIWMEEARDSSGRIFITEQEGRILIVQKGSDGSEALEFLNITNRNPHFNNEDGLLGMALHPGFKTNGLVYISYTLPTQGTSLPPTNFPYRSLISEIKVSAMDSNKADLSSERILLDVPQPFWNHKGGQISFGPDSFLYIALGDGGSANDPFNNGQNTANLLGKILRIDVNSRDSANKLEYGIPKDNPFVNERWDVRKEIYAFGLRNPWRFSWDRETGTMWAGDVGQVEFEEVDIIINGGNYGWCVREAFHSFKPGPPSAAFIEPIIEYGHSPQLQAQSKFHEHSAGTSVTGGYVYRGKKLPALQGVYVYGDYTLGTIWGLRYKNGELAEHGTLFAQPKNVASFAEDLDGELYMLTGTYSPTLKENNGKIYSIVVP